MTKATTLTISASFILTALFIAMAFAALPAQAAHKSAPDRPVVKELQSKHHNFKKGKHKQRLSFMAETLGISVEDLKAAKDDPELMEQFKTEMKERMTPEFKEEMKTKFEAERDAHLAKIAEERGVTVEELKEKMKSKFDRKHGDQSWHKSDGSGRLKIHPRRNHAK